MKNMSRNSVFDQIATRLDARDFREKDRYTGYFIDQPAVMNAPVALLVHGVSGSALDGIFLAEKLYEAGYKIYLLDLPGHGKAKVEDFSDFDALGKWLADFVDHTSPQMVVSQSYASAILYSAASQELLPDSLYKAYCCPTPNMSRKTTVLKNLADVLPAGVATPIYHSYPAVWVRTKIMHKDGKKVSFSRMIESENNKSTTLSVRQVNQLTSLLSGDNPYYKRSLRSTDKSLVFYGTMDNVVTAKTSDEINKIFQGTKIIEIPKVGHLLHFEAYEQIADELVNL